MCLTLLCPVAPDVPISVVNGAVYLLIFAWTTLDSFPDTKVEVSVLLQADEYYHHHDYNTVDSIRHRSKYR